MKHLSAQCPTDQTSLGPRMQGRKANTPAWVVAGLLGLVALPSLAGTVTKAPTRLDLLATDSLVWGALADDLISKASPYALTSTGGVGVTATLTGGFTVLKQNGAAYTANFADGETVLQTGDINGAGPADGPVNITFSSAVRGVGFNIAHLDFGSFTGTMNYYGAGDVLFGTTTVNGTSSAANDGSAAFLGGFSSLKDIVRVEVSVDLQGGSRAFAINQMSLNTAISPIPEPATAVLMALGLGAGILRRGRGRRTAA